MKFNEKLMELRKKEGLSQEELGYKLNVTRQTVSKWELGQTTPEMDKLKEISKIFNISVDELINEAEVVNETKTKIENQPIVDTDDNKKEKNMKIIIIGALVIVIILIVVKIATAIPIFNKVNDTVNETANSSKNIIERVIDFFDKIINYMGNTDMENTGTEVTPLDPNDFSEEMKDMEDKKEVTLFNFSLENDSGTQKGIFVKNTLDDIIKSNKKNERKITLKYNETETQDTEEIKNLKSSFEDFNDYEISIDYDEQGFINKVTIENL